MGAKGVILLHPRLSIDPAKAKRLYSQGFSGNISGGVNA